MMSRWGYSGYSRGRHGGGGRHGALALEYVKIWISD